MKDVVAAPMRSVILWSLAVCAAIAMAPWLSGGEEPLARLIGAGALLLGVLFIWREPTVRRLSGGPLRWTYVGLAAWGSLSLLWTANRYSTVLWIVNLVTMGLAFRLAYTIAGEVRGRERLVRLYLISAVLFCLYGIYLYITGDYNRLTGSIYWANPAAAYLITAVLIAADRLGSGGRWRWLWLGLTTLLTSSFILTDSRAATLVLGLVLVLLLLLRKVERRFWIHFLFSVIATVLATAGLVQARSLDHPHTSGVVVTAPGSRFAEAATGESRSVDDRLNYLRSAVQIWENHPFGGSGAGTYGDVHPQYQIKVVSAATSAHNIYVQTWAELGVLGFLLLLWVVALILIGSVRGLFGDPTGLPLLLGLIGLLLHFGLDIDAHYPALLLLASVLAGLLYEQRYRQPIHASWRLLVGAAVLLIPVVSLYQSDAWAQKGAAAQTDGDYPLASADYANAHHGLLYNPDVINAEGIDYYTVALGGGPDAKTAAALALDRAHEAEAQDPADAQHHQLEGRVLQLMGNLTGAQAALQTAISLDSYNHPDYYYDLASILASEGKFTNAIGVAQTALAFYPDSVIANRNADPTVRTNVARVAALLGNLELQQGDTSAAKAALLRGEQVDPTNLRVRALANQLTKLGL